ncbi:MAG: ABC transporter substrate-binding protein [Rhodospirillales bacterium]|nr:MAG: ABC transporter substrate-binding protein [Rhodospirillales bacterium]
MRIVRIVLALVLSSTAAASAAAPKTLVFCSKDSPDTFNPQLSTSAATFDASARQVYDRLVMFDPRTWEITPSLAVSWEISGNGLEYVIHLRKDVSFHATREFRPTRPLNAHDVVFSFNRQLDRKHPWHRVSGGTYRYFEALGLDQLIESVTARDEGTVTFRLARPHASFLAFLAMDFASILSAEYAQALVEAGAPERLDREPVGTGPFRLVQYQRDALIRFAAHRSYWRGVTPLDNLVFAIVPDAGVRLQKLRSGECHIIDQPDPADLPALERDPNIRVLRQTNNNLGFLAFNTRRWPLSDVRIRRALALAIDREAIIDQAYEGSGMAAIDALPPSTRRETAGGIVARPDSERARRILDEIITEPLRIEIWVPPVDRPYLRNARQIAELIREDWAAIGVETSIRVPDWESFLKHSMIGAHQAILFGWVGETLDPDVFLWPILSCGSVDSGANRSRWCDPAFDRLLEEARRTTGRAARAAIYDAALQRLAEQVPFVPLAHSLSFTPLRREVTGYTASPLGGHSFYGVDLLRAVP